MVTFEKLTKVLPHDSDEDVTGNSPKDGNDTLGKSILKKNVEESESNINSIQFDLETTLTSCKERIHEAGFVQQVLEIQVSINFSWISIVHEL